jgi:hypothetical protein
LFCALTDCSKHYKMYDTRTCVICKTTIANRESFRCCDADVCSKSCSARRIAQIKAIDPALDHPDKWMPAGSHPPLPKPNAGGTGRAPTRSMKRIDSRAFLIPDETCEDGSTVPHSTNRRNSLTLTSLCGILVFAFMMLRYFE